MALIDVDYIVDRAEALSPAARCMFGLLATSLLEPALQLDDSAEGRSRRDFCIALWKQAADAVGDYTTMRVARDVVVVSEELSYDLEPEGPESYRIDFMAAMLYAINSYIDGSQRDFNWCIQRVADSLSFLLNPSSDAAARPSLTQDLSEIISALDGGQSLRSTLACQLSPVLEKARGVVRQLMDA